MGVVKNLMVRAGADFSPITAQAKKVKASMSGMQASVSKSCSRISAAAGGLKKAFAVLGAAVSVGAIVSFSKDAKEAYEAQIEAEAKLAQVMRNTMGAASGEIASIKELCSAQQELGVIGDEVQLAGAQELATYLTMSSSLKTLIPVMNDMAAQQYGLGASAESVTAIATMLGKVMNGQTSALSRYGYTFTAAQEAVLKYGTEAQWAAVLAQVVGESVGGMNAALAATPSGRLQQVSNTLGDIKEGFGSAVTTVLTVFLPVLNTVCSVLASAATLANKVAQSIANVFGGGAKSAATAVSYTGAAVSAMGDLGDETKSAGKAAASLGTYGFDKLQKMSGASGSSGGGAAGAEAAEVDGAGGGIVETAAGMEEAGESVGWLERVLNRLKETAEKIDLTPLTDALDRLKTAAEPLTEAFFSGLSWAYENVFEPLAQWTVESALPAFLDVLSSACGLISSALERLKPLGQWLWDNFLAPVASWTGGVITSVLGDFADLLQGIADVISGNLSLGDFFNDLSFGEGVLLAVGGAIGIVTAAVGAWSLISGVATAATTALGVAVNILLSPITLVIAAIAAVIGIIILLVKNWDTVKEVAANVWARIQEVWSAVCEWFNTNVIQPLAAFFSGLWEGIKNIASAVWEGIKGIWTAVSSWFNTYVIQPIAGFFSGLWNGIKTAAGTAWNGIVGVWTAVSGWFDTNVIQPVAGFFGGLWEGIKSAAASVWEGIKGVWQAAGTWFTDHVITPISNGFKGFANGIIGFFEGLANGAISGVNTIIRALNKISFDIPEWVPVIGGKTFGFNLGTISPVALPRLANGAVFQGNDPYLAVVNDQKHGVNVETPLATMIEAMMTALRSVDLLGDIQVDVRAVFDGQLAALARLLRPYFEADAKRVGNRASTSKGVI